MKTLWTEKEVEFLEKNYKDMFYNEIGRILNRSYKSVSRKAECLGLWKKTNKLWSDDEIMYVIDNYNSIPPIKLANNLNRTYNAVILKAENLGLCVDHAYHKPPYNEEFFNVWSNELAWLVGIVLSDGHVSAINNGRFVRVRMCDKDVLEKIKNIVGYTKNLCIYHPKNPRYKTAYIVELRGRLIWQFFTDLGMDNHKSYTAKFPTVDDKYIMHVIRGVFDGDGSIHIGRKNYPFARVCGTPNAMNSIVDYIGLHCTKHSNSDTNIIIQYTGERALQFLEYIYQDSTPSVRMDRKYNKYLDVLKFWKGVNK